MMIIMESLDTMLSDAVNISAILTLDTKLHKFRQLKKQMSNISAPSPAATPEPGEDLVDHIENDVISETVLKTINDEDASEQVDACLDTPVTIGDEFFPSSTITSISSSSSSETMIVSETVQTSTQLTCLTRSGKNLKYCEQIFFMKQSTKIIFRCLK